MVTINVTVDESLRTNRIVLAMLITKLQFESHPELELKYGITGKQKCVEDATFHLTYLEEAIRLDSKALFSSYLQWALIMLEARSIPAQVLVDNLECMKRSCRQVLLPEFADIAEDYIKYGIDYMRNSNLPVTYLLPDNPLQKDSEKYLSLLLDGNRKEALLLVNALVKGGKSIGDIYEFIFQTTQYEVGLLWQRNKITVAHEHYCTAVTQQIMSTLYTNIFDTAKRKLKMLACAISGDLHEIGIRMLSDVFEMDGWDTYYMGANMPHINIISAIKEQKADLLAISVTMPFHIREAGLLIDKIRRDRDLSGLRIIIGGYPFSIIPDLWKRLGADGTAKNAREAIILANQLIY